MDSWLNVLTPFAALLPLVQTDTPDRALPPIHQLGVSPNIIRVPCVQNVPACWGALNDWYVHELHCRCAHANGQAG